MISLKLLPILYGLEHLGAVQAVCQKYLDAAQTAAQNLQSKYFYPNGTYGNQAIWIGAVDTLYLGRLDTLTGANNYTTVIDTVYHGNENYLNTGESYDDVQWVAISYLGAGNVTEGKHFYDIASTAVDSTYCGGGLFWSGARNYKNAITNELYMASSGFMYESTKDEQYLKNLNATWNWLNASGMRGSNGLFNDGLTNDGKCANNGETQWTYNQGVVLVGLASLYKYSKDEHAITTAFSIMDAVIAILTHNGGLRESCESTTENLCNLDEETFKGIYVYYMAWFLNISGRDNGSKYSDFVKIQADKVLTNAATSSGWYSNLWYDPSAGGASSSSSTQAAALGALLAAAQQDC